MYTVPLEASRSRIDSVEVDHREFEDEGKCMYHSLRDMNISVQYIKYGVGLLQSFCVCHQCTL